MRRYHQSQVTRCYDLAADEYSKAFLHELVGKPLDRWLLQRFAESVPADDRILDFGCGSGQTTRFVHDLGKTNIVGLDLSLRWPRMQGFPKHTAGSIEMRANSS
jgi:SAM-dependent methyltransferase